MAGLKETLRQTETSIGRGQQIPFKPYTEIEALHGGIKRLEASGRVWHRNHREVIQGINGIFRTELPGEPSGSITFAEAITGQRLHTWTVRMEKGEEALALVQRLYDFHTNFVPFERATVNEIVGELSKLCVEPSASFRPPIQGVWILGVDLIPHEIPGLPGLSMVKL